MKDLGDNEPESHAGLQSIDTLELVSDDSPVLEFDDPLAHLVDHEVVVGGHQDRRARSIDPVEESHDADACAGVEVARRLVAQEDRRSIDESPSDGDPLLLAAGELMGQALLLARKPDEVQDLGNARLDVAAILADDLKGESDILEYVFIREQSEVLKHRSYFSAQQGDAPRRQLGQVSASHVDSPGGRAFLPKDEFEEGGFPRAGRPNEEHKVSPLDGDAHLVERGSRATGVHLADIAEMDHSGWGPWGRHAPLSWYVAVPGTGQEPRRMWRVRYVTSRRI